MPPVRPIPTTQPYDGPVRTKQAVCFGTDEVPDSRRVGDLGTRHPAYRRFYEDGRLDISVIFGFDKAGRASMHGGFEAVAEVLRDAGWRVSQEDGQHYLLTRTAVIDGAKVELRMQLVSGHGNPRAKEELLDSLRHDEVVIFVGHSRMHEGLRLSDGGAGFLRLAQEPGTDLRRVQFGNQHQLFVMMSCLSDQFCDELRTRKGPERLKLFASNRQLVLSDYPEMVERFVGQLERMGSAQDLLDALDKGNLFTPEGAWSSFGFADDP